jgi:hypothetical protein
MSTNESLEEIKAMANPVSVNRRCNNWHRHKTNSSIFLMFIMGALMVVPASGEDVKSGRQHLKGISLRFQAYSSAVGLRLRFVGKERITATGTLLSYTGDLETKEAATIIWQFPQKIRMDFAGKVMKYDGNKAKQTIPADSKKAEALQVLLEDSLEGFLAIDGTRGSSRDMGSGYRLPNARPENSCMDIIHMSYQDAFSKRKKIDKAYWFDCNTKLLGTVTYLCPLGSRIHVVVEDWRDIAGEKIPFRIERWEEGQLTMRLTLDEATISAGVEDSTFEGN